MALWRRGQNNTSGRLGFSGPAAEQPGILPPPADRRVWPGRMWRYRFFATAIPKDLREGNGRKSQPCGTNLFLAMILLRMIFCRNSCIFSRPAGRARSRCGEVGLNLRQSSRRRRRSKLLDHVARGGLDGLLPARRAEAFGSTALLAMGEDDAAGVVDDRAQPVGVEGARPRRAAVPPWLPKPGTRNQVCGIAARSSANCCGYVAPTTAPTAP